MTEKQTMTKQYWIDFAVYLETDGPRITDTVWVPLEFAADPIRERCKHGRCAELLLPYHAPDGKKYGLTCYMVQLPNAYPAIMFAGQLQKQIPQVLNVYGSLCQEVEVES